MGSSPTDRPRIFPTKDEELSQIYVPLFVGIVGSNLSDPTKPDSALSCEKKLIMSYIHENICHPFSVWGSIAGKKMEILVFQMIARAGGGGGGCDGEVTGCGCSGWGCAGFGCGADFA